MKMLKKTVAALCLLAIVCTSPARVDAREYCTDTGGGGYSQARDVCCMAPAVVFALALIGAIIAVGVHNRHHSSHCHCH